jgi:hypothetical protein
MGWRAAGSEAQKRVPASLLGGATWAFERPRSIRPHLYARSRHLATANPGFCTGFTVELHRAVSCRR